MKSFVLCRSYGVNNHFVHPPWAVLLEGEYSEFFLQGSLLLTQDFVTVNKGRPKQEQASQSGGSCPDVLWYPHSHLLVGRHVLPADVSSFFLTVPLDSLSYNTYNVLHPVIGSGLA